MTLMQEMLIAPSFAPQRPGVDLDAVAARLEPLLACPVDASPMRWDAAARTFVSEGGRRYAPQNGIPSFFVPNEWSKEQEDVTDIVKAFYEETPFPNYDDLDDRRSLKQKASAGTFGKLLDDQLPNPPRCWKPVAAPGSSQIFWA